MTKLIAFLRWPGMSDDGFARLVAYAENLPAERITVDRIGPRPPGLPYAPPSEQASAATISYDAIVSLGDTMQVPDWHDLAGSNAIVCDAYSVEEQQMFDRGAPRRIGQSPGIKLFGLLDFHPDLPDSAARRSWRLHAGLAERVHVGASRYTQNWVTRRLSQDAPRARGMPEMTFPSQADLIDRFFDSPRGQDEILHDIAHFIASGPRFYVVEHVVR